VEEKEEETGRSDIFSWFPEGTDHIRHPHVHQSSFIVRAAKLDRLPIVEVL